MAQSAANACSTAAEEVNDNKEIANGFKVYMDLFYCPTNQFKFSMAPNAVVDWFGRAVRGAERISDYMRTEVCSQYAHVDFKHADECAPIEYKPSHYKTKICSLRKVELVNPLNSVTDATTLKNRADSDVDDDSDAVTDDMDVEMLSLQKHYHTAEKLNKSIIEELTPPSSAVKNEASNINADAISDSDDDEVVGVKAKRLKRSQPVPFSYLRRIPTSRTTTTLAAAAKAKRKLLNNDEIRTLLDDTSSDEDEDADMASKYTALRYFETTGVLRTLANARQFCVDNASMSSWERQVRIRVSYRKHLLDQHLQFALVIYEHLERVAKTQTMRRNLMLEFNQAVANETAHDNADNDVSSNMEETTSTITTDEQPALVVNEQDETVVATVTQPTTDEIAAALETAAFTIVPLRTPTKHVHTPPATPKRKPRHMAMSGLKHLNLTPTTIATPKRNAARSLRL